MIVYDPKDTFRTLAWVAGIDLVAMHSGLKGLTVHLQSGSVILYAVPLACFCAVLAVVSVYVLQSYSFSIDKLGHTVLGNSLGFLLVYRSTREFRNRKK